MSFSVLLPVHGADNAEHFRAALHSISAAQTLKPSEIVIVKDGPLGDRIDSVLHQADPEVRAILKEVVLPASVGLAQALNHGLAECSFDLVARMDSDDISTPERFEEQVNFMSSRPFVQVCGTNIEEYDETMTNRLGARRVPNTQEAILKFAKSRSPFNHPSVMYRRTAVLAVGGYPNYRKAQDYGLWIRMIEQGYQMENLDRVLVKMRAGPDFFARRGATHALYFSKIYRTAYRIRLISAPRLLFNLLSLSTFFFNRFLKRLLYSRLLRKF